MRRPLMVAGLAAVIVMAGSACSTRGEYFEQVTRENGAHFATWNHMGYSLFRATPKDTTKQDILLSQTDKCVPSKDCPWFGEVVRVEPIL